MTEPVSKFQEALAAGKFVITGEIGPPKGTNIGPVIHEAETYLKGRVVAVNVTDIQTAVMRTGSLVGCKLLLDHGIEPVYQMVCRDRNRLAMQADILGAYLLGVRNLLCLSGDHQCFGNHPTARYVFDLDSVQLIQMVRNMRDKKIFANGEEIKISKKAEPKEPRMFIGCAANPFADPFDFRAVRLEKKIVAGADFVQTQCIFDMDRFDLWMEQVRARGLHERCKILAGVTPLKSVGMATHMRDHVAGLILPNHYVDRLARAADPKAEGVAICVEQIRRLREVKGLAGIHIMAVEWEEKVAEIVEKAGLRKKRE